MAKNKTTLDGRHTTRDIATHIIMDVMRCFPKHEVLAKFDVDEILTIVPEQDDGNYGQKTAIETHEGIIRVSIASKKLLTFKKSVVCAGCYDKGEYFLLIRNPIIKGRASLELFTASGKLLTRDHIIPKSLGGSNDMSNSQTMCLMCNSKKGSQMPE